MARVFLFEHEEYWINFIQQNLRDIAGEEQSINFVLATNVEEAAQVLSDNQPGLFDLLLIDLFAPPRPGVEPEYVLHAGEGFTVVETAWNKGHRENIIVLSAIADHPPTVAANRRLTDKGVTYQVLDKEKDLTCVADWKNQFSEYFEDLDPLVRYLERKHHIFVVDEKQHHTLRQLTRFVRGTLRDSTTRRGLPVLCLNGPSRSGKSTIWAPCMPLIKQYLLYNGDPPEGTEPVRYSEFALNALSKALTESERGKLFGFYRWTHEGGRIINEDGRLMDATYYHSRPNVVSGSNPRTLRTDSRLGGYCLLDELLSCHTEVQELLYSPIDKRVVTTEGVGAREYPVDCTIILATNYDIGSAVARGERPDQVGTIPEAMLNRIHAFVRTPSLQDLSFDSVLQIIGRYGKGIQPVAADALRRYHEDGTLSFDRLRVLATVEASGPRITKMDLERYVSTLIPPDLAPRAKSPQMHISSVEPILDGLSALDASEEKISSLGWPGEVSDQDLQKAMSAWKVIQKTDGAGLGDEEGVYDVENAVAKFNLSPGGLLVLIILAYAESQAGVSSKERIDRWFGISESNPLRAKVATLSKKYQSVFKGSGRGGVVRIKDLKKWADSWTEQRRRAAPTSGK